MAAVTVLNGAPLRRIEVDKGKVRMGRWPYTISSSMGSSPRLVWRC